MQEEILTPEREEKADQGFNLMIARRRKGKIEEKYISQEDVSFITGISQSVISQDENSETIPDERIDKYAEALGCSTNFLKNYKPDEHMGYYETNNPTSNDNSSFTLGSHAAPHIEYNDSKAVEVLRDWIKEKDILFKEYKEEKKQETAELKAEIRELRDILIKR